MAIAQSNVRFWHDLKEGSGTSIADEHGGGAATKSANPTWTTTGPTGISTNCVSFAGTVNGDNILAATNSVSQVAFCFAQWFYHAGSGNFAHMAGLKTTTGGDHAINIYKDTSNVLNFRVVNPGVGNDFIITAGAAFTTSAWNLVIFQRDSGGNAEAFVNGISQGTASNATAISALPMVIGNAFDVASSDWAWGGKLSQSILFDTTLTSGERASLYNSGAGTTYSSFFASTPSRLALLGVG